MKNAGLEPAFSFLDQLDEPVLAVGVVQGLNSCKVPVPK